MAKRSQWVASIRSGEKLEDFFKKQGYSRAAAGFGNFSFNRELPTSPPTAYYLRRYSSFWDSVKAFRAETPAKSEEEMPEAWAIVPFRREAADRILSGLGEHTPTAVEYALTLCGGDRKRALASLSERRDNYGAAEDALFAWCEQASHAAGIPENEGATPDHPDPRVRAAWEVLYWIHPLLWAFAAPRHFFQEIAPQIDPNNLFDPKKLVPHHPFISHGALASCLHTWGYGAVLNPAVSTALTMAANSPNELTEILNEAEGKEPYVEGPPRGKTRGKPKRRRVDNFRTLSAVHEIANEYEQQTGAPRGGGKVATELIAQKEGVSPEGIRKRIQRARRGS